jgi:uncharacterized protein (DUF1810 family)
VAEGREDTFDLDRFVAAQDPVFDDALAELRAGRKRSHWMWFVFPQLKGLGRSPTADFYGIGTAAEARAYLAHPLLGPRLDAALAALDASPGRSLHEVFGSPDDLKFCSSMTLFAAVAPGGPYRRALERWCGGRGDARTLALLADD